MWDILTFNSFVTQDVLIFFYYIFALLVPLFLWALRLYIIKKIRFNQKHKLITLLTFITIFLCMELSLRMVFEMMIGYFDMHDYLYEISQNLK